MPRLEQLGEHCSHLETEVLLKFPVQAVGLVMRRGDDRRSNTPAREQFGEDFRQLGSRNATRNTGGEHLSHPRQRRRWSRSPGFGCLRHEYTGSPTHHDETIYLE